MAGRPLGAENKDKPYRAAMRMEASLAEQAKPCTAPVGSLRWIARSQLNKAGEDTAAANHVADRLDGKPAQAVDMDIAIGPNEAFLELMRRVSAGDFAKPIQVIDGTLDNGVAALTEQPAAIRNGRSNGHANGGTANGAGGHSGKRSRRDKGSA